jgi:hypothetical protein
MALHTVRLALWTTLSHDGAMQSGAKVFSADGAELLYDGPGPIYNACRALLERGADPADRLAIILPGQEPVASITLGRAIEPKRHERMCTPRPPLDDSQEPLSIRPKPDARAASMARPEGTSRREYVRSRAA